MKIPVIRGVIDRRILVNYQVDPDHLARLLPPPFKPKLFRGCGLAGICLIRLCQIRPKMFPAFVGISSENAAHRFAVERDENGVRREGVFVTRRDTSSRINSFAGGRLFPGVHHHARFDVAEKNRQYRIAIQSDDAVMQMRLVGHLSESFPRDSIFEDLESASRFFEQGSSGYSVTSKRCHFDGIELRCANWSVSSLEIENLKSNYFDDRSLFPPGTLKFDCALLMHGIHHEWHGLPTLCATRC